MKKSNNGIQKTTDYTLFKRVPGNRRVSKAHVNRLSNSIAHNPSLIEIEPIIVNDKMEIIDGQHRAEACEKMELPVYYKVKSGLTLTDVQLLNANSRTWNMVDYARSFAELGNRHYKLYLEFLDIYKLGKSITANYLILDGNFTKEAFMDGKFKITSIERSHELFQGLTEVAKHHNFDYNTKTFSNAFKQAWLTKECNHSRLVTNLEKYGDRIRAWKKAKDYLRDFEEVYNLYLRGEKEIRFN